MYLGLNRSSKKTLKKHHRQESNVSVSSVSSVSLVSSTETTNSGFEFVESRGEWSMIYDELTGARCFLMKRPGSCRSTIRVVG